MKQSIKILFIPLLALFGFTSKVEAPKADACAIPNNAFKAGEKVSMTVYYNVAGVYVDAGNAVFTNKLESLGGKPVYHIVAEGKTNKTYDWIFKVRDKYETYMDTNTLQTLKFVRNVDEGGYKKYQNVTFNKSTNVAITNDGPFKVPACVHDVVSSVFYARNIDFSKLRPNDKIAFSMFLDNEVHNMYIRYLGKEVIKTQYGRFKAIKFKPMLIKGTIFEGGEKMTVWVSDDQNHLPLRVESPIIVGKVKIDMMGYENLRYPPTSLIKRR